MTERYILFDDGPNGGVQAFADPVHMIVAWQPADVAQAMDAMQAARDAGKWLAGFASYELGYVLEPKLSGLLPKLRQTPLLCFGVFNGPDAIVARSLMHRGIANAMPQS